MRSSSTPIHQNKKSPITGKTYGTEEVVQHKPSHLGEAVDSHLTLYTRQAIPIIPDLVCTVQLVLRCVIYVRAQVSWVLSCNTVCRSAVLMGRGCICCVGCFSLSEITAVVLYVGIHPTPISKGGPYKKIRRSKTHSRAVAMSSIKKNMTLLLRSGSKHF